MRYKLACQQSCSWKGDQLSQTRKSLQKSQCWEGKLAGLLLFVLELHVSSLLQQQRTAASAQPTFPAEGSEMHRRVPTQSKEKELKGCLAREKGY